MNGAFERLTALFDRRRMLAFFGAPLLHEDNAQCAVVETGEGLWLGCHAKPRPRLEA